MAKLICIPETKASIQGCATCTSPEAVACALVTGSVDVSHRLVAD